MHISEELLAQFHNAEPNETFFVDCMGSAKAVTIAELDPTEAAVVTAYTDAAGAPMITDGKPTAIRMCAWMAHGDGVINDNRVAFVSEEIKPFVATVNDTNPLVMDFNHSAVKGYADDPKMIGAWTRAEWAFNPAAANGTGAWGILLSGVMMAWLFPNIADTILADQARNGYTRNSMACMSRGIEFKSDADGPYQILHNPVFFTLSVLDVPPADKAAIGKAVEGSSDPQCEATMKDQLLHKASVVTPPMSPQAPVVLQEAVMTDEETKALTEAAAAAQAQLTEQTAELESMKSRLVEVETARDAVAAELEKANVEIARVSDELKAASEKLAAFESAEAATAHAARVASRIASLPETYREAHAKKDEAARTRVETKWAAMSDEEFEQYKAEELLFAVGSMKVGYVERSEKEGFLQTGTAPEDEEFAAKIKSAKK